MAKAFTALEQATEGRALERDDIKSVRILHFRS
jgi:hypothetical protein